MENVTEGASRVQSVTQSYDTANGLGSSFHELAHGVDCPFHASFLDSAAFVDRDSPLLHPQSICIWEQDTGSPLWRHYTQVIFCLLLGLPTPLPPHLN